MFNKILMGIIFCSFFVFFCCVPCGDLNVSDFESNLNTFERVKEIVRIKELRTLNLSQLKKEISNEDYFVLKKLNFKGVSSRQNVFVFKFSHRSEGAFLEKKIDNKLKTDTRNKACNYFLFHSKENDNLTKIAHYEQYSECRKEYEEINKHWIYSSQVWYCTD